MIRLYSFVFCLLMALPVRGRNSLQIALNPVDCLNCTNRIHLLTKINRDNTSIDLIFAEGYKGEYNSLLKKLNIRESDYNLIFSDQLYGSIMGLTTVSKGIFFSSQGIDTIRFDLKDEFDHEFIYKINQMSNSEYVISSTNQIISQSTRDIRNNNCLLYALNKLDNTIHRIDLTDSKSVVYFRLSDDILRAILNTRMKDANYYDSRNLLFNENGVFQKDEILDYQIYNNEAIITTSHKVLEYDGKDTFLSSVYCLIITKDGHVSGLHFLENGEDDFKYNPINFYFRNTEIVLPLYKTINSNKVFKVEKYIYKKDQSLELGGTFDADRNDSVNVLIPFNIITSLISGKYIFHTVYNEILDYEKQENIKLDFIPLVRTDGIESTRMNVFDFKVAGDVVFVFYCDFQERNAYYVKYSITNRDIIDKYVHSLIDLKIPTSFSIDNFDFNYLWIPLNNNSVLRKKVLN